jgi:hypothetical protein
MGTGGRQTLVDCVVCRILGVIAVGSIAWLSQAGVAILPVAQAARVEPARHTVFRYAAYLAYCAMAGRRRYRIVTIEMPITDLPPSFDGLRIVHLSDLHIGDFMSRRSIRRAVDLANSAQPDLAVLTGDLIPSERDLLGDCIAELSRSRRLWMSGAAMAITGVGQAWKLGRRRSLHATARMCCGSSVRNCPGVAVPSL